MRDHPWLGLLLALSAASCARAPDRPLVWPVKGRVLYEGRPAAGAVVILHTTDEAAKAIRPHGRADANGEFELTTYVAGDGAPAAAYVVTVEWKRAEDHPEQGLDLLPPVYSDPNASRLKVTVAPGPNEPLVLPLTARP